MRRAPKLNFSAYLPECNTLKSTVVFELNEGTWIAKLRGIKRLCYPSMSITNTLDWTENVNSLTKKGNQRLYFLRKLNNLNIDRTILVLFCQSLIQSLLTFNLVCYFGNGTQQNRDRLDRVRRVAEHVTGQDLPSLKHLFEQRVLSKIDKIMADESHPLNEHYTFNRSGIKRTKRDSASHLSQIPSIYSTTLPEGITILSFILL